MRERRALREARGAGGVLNVDRVIELQLTFDLGDLRVAHTCSGRKQRVPFRVDHERIAKHRTAVTHFREDRDIIRLPEAASEAEQAHAALVERVFQFARLVRRVDVHEDRADSRGRVLERDPLEAVRCPHADTIAGLHPASEQTLCGAVHQFPQLAVSHAEVLMSHNERFAVTESLNGAAQVLANRFTKQRGRTCAVRVGRERHGAGLHSGRAVRLWPPRRSAASGFSYSTLLAFRFASGIFSSSFGGDLARCFAAGRCCVVRVFTTAHGLRKAVPAPLSGNIR